MTAINFGVGTMIGRRTDVTNPTPAFFGILQELEIDFDQSLKELIGQYRVAVDVAFATLKITGKAKFARIQSNIMNDMFFGNTVEDSAGEDMSVAEAHVVPAAVTIATSADSPINQAVLTFAATTTVVVGTSVSSAVSGAIPAGAYVLSKTGTTVTISTNILVDVPSTSVITFGPTVVMTNTSTFENDLGVFYGATSTQLECVAPGTVTAGSYSVNAAGGYSFATGDVGKALLFYYSYTIMTAKQINITNPLLGTGPSFQLSVKEQYTNNAGVVNTMFIKLNACRSSKLTMPFKNVDYTIQEFDFEAFADQGNNIGSITVTE